MASTPSKTTSGKTQPKAQTKGGSSGSSTSPSKTKSGKTTAGKPTKTTPTKQTKQTKPKSDQMQLTRFKIGNFSTQKLKKKLKITWTKPQILMIIFDVIGYINWWLMFVYTTQLFRPLKIYQKYKNISTINNIIIVSIMICLGSYILYIVPKNRENAMIIIALAIALPMFTGFLMYSSFYEATKYKMDTKQRKQKLMTFYVSFLSLNTIFSMVMLIFSFIFNWDQPKNLINIIIIIGLVFAMLLQVWLNIQFTNEEIYKKFYEKATET